MNWTWAGPNLVGRTHKKMSWCWATHDHQSSASRPIFSHLALHWKQRVWTVESETAMATSLLSPFSSPISPSTVDAHDVGFIGGAVKSSFLHCTKLFSAPKLGRRVVLPASSHRCDTSSAPKIKNLHSWFLWKCWFLLWWVSFAGNLLIVFFRVVRINLKYRSSHSSPTNSRPSLGIKCIWYRTHRGQRWGRYDSADFLNPANNQWQGDLISHKLDK